MFSCIFRCRMECKWDTRLGFLFLLLQLVCGEYSESAPPPCSPGFTSDLFLFKVHREHLQRDMRIGTVVFSDCSGRALTVFESADKRFHVASDGTLKVKRRVTLHNGHKMFSVHAWDSSGKKHTALVKIELSRRIKREWVIPPIKIAENSKGKDGGFPEKMVQIKSSHAKETKIEYSITGEGANQLFTIDKSTGWLSVSGPLDREKKDHYVLQAHAISHIDPSMSEPEMEIIVEVTDVNDNTPFFTQDPFTGSVPEASQIGYEFMAVNATDADEPGSVNTDIRYTIVSQIPADPQPNMFAINPMTGVIRVNADGLDREKISSYNLKIQVADLEGEGRRSTGNVVITVTDSNDNPPQFEKSLYNVTVPENKEGFLVVKMMVTDEDEPQTPAWAAKFKITSGNTGGFFSVSTGLNKQEGIITTVKPLDYESNNKYTLLVSVENEVPFVKVMPTSTATVIVNVLDVNEAPVFNPTVKEISKREDVAVGEDLVVYTATDPDIGKDQKLTYRAGDDPAGWLNVVPDTGLIKVKSPMDRESPFVKDNKYKAIIWAIDNDPLPATGTGTLVIELQDVNDNAPVIEERSITVCNKDPVPVVLTVTDKDASPFSAPFTVDLNRESKNNWTAKMNDSKTGIILSLKTPLENGIYNVVMKVYDSQLLSQDCSIEAHVCDCTGADFFCNEKLAGIGFPAVLGILGAILALLLLVLLLLLFLRRKNTKKDPPLINDTDTRDNVYYYDEEGGGEDDQDYDLSVLHRGLDNRPDVFRNDVAPTFMSAPQYRPRPANPEDIATFIDDNLKAADEDPTAPPYDSLLVFDYEGGGSEAGSLSSLNSSSSGDQDYDRLNEWGPRFKKLADMYGGGED